MKKRMKIILTVFLFLPSSLFVLMYLYSTRIHFVGELKWMPGNAVQEIEAVGPFNKNHFTGDCNTSVAGYYTDIFFIKNDTVLDPAVYQFFAGDSIQLSYTRISGNSYQLTAPEITFLHKAEAIIQYSISLIIAVIIFLFFLLFMVFRYNNLFIKDVIKSIPRWFSDVFDFFKLRRLKIIAALLISFLIYPVLLCLFGISFPNLYNLPHTIMCPFVGFVFFIPIFGFLLRFKYRSFGYAFFAFWLIFFLMYFIISPFAFAGNFGFYSYLHNFTLVPLQNGFFKSLFIPDTGYFAMLPRMVYGVSEMISTDASQSIAISSIISLTIYSLIFGFLASERFRFLWPSHWSGFIFVVLMAVFPIFSLVPGNKFLMPITDTAYYGFLFSLGLLFIVRALTFRSVYLFTFINCIFILSKAHFLVLFPLYAIALIMFVRGRNQKGIILTVFSLAAIFIQGIFCYMNMMQMSAQGITGTSFSLNILGIREQIIIAVTYYLKSYMHILLPFADATGINVIILICLIIAIILTLLCFAVRMMKRSRNELLAVWFIAGNILAFSATLFYAYTLPQDAIINRTDTFGLIRSVDVNLMRYTIGIHTILAVTVIPFAVFLLSGLFKRIIPKYAFRTTIALLLVLLANGLIFNNAAISFPHFWSMTRGDRWSFELKQLAPLLKNKEHYVPNIFYPAIKEEITDNLELSNDFIPNGQSGFSLKGAKNVHAIIVINASENKDVRIPVIAETYYKGKKMAQLTPLYETNPSIRFIYFLNKESSAADSLVFLNHLHRPAMINTHIRVVSYKKDH